MVEWDVVPVVVNAFVIEAYAVLAVVEYLQVAASSVVRDKVVEVMVADRVPEGRPLLLEGGVVSVGVLAVKFAVIVLLLFIVTVAGFVVPVRSPDQLLNV